MTYVKLFTPTKISAVSSRCLFYTTCATLVYNRTYLFDFQLVSHIW